MSQEHQSAESAGETQRLPYLVGLDGLRAIAVAAVVFYHAGVSLWGGFLGVESCFALSGFLITALLFAEWQQRGAIDLRTFWMRRMRRLFPALGLVIAFVIALVWWLPSGDQPDFGSDLAASVGYVMNWHLILAEQSYFDPAARPPLLQHLWSLAIEEQFYLLWPLIFIAGMALVGRKGLVALAVIGALASSVWMATLAQQAADQSRLYFGTDTRASALLLGAALGLLWQPWRRAITPQRGRGLAIDLLGFAALAGLLYAYQALTDYDPRLYQGGFFAVSLLTLIVIMATTSPHARWFPRLLELAPLRWIGVRSYGIYLWHWPIFMVTRPYIDLTPPIHDTLFLIARIAAVLLVADLSYRFFEDPIRRGALGRFIRARQAAPVAPAPARRPATPVSGIALVEE